MSFKNSVPDQKSYKQLTVIAPGMAFQKKELDLSVEILKSWGLEVDVPKGLIGSHPVSASSVKQRELHLEQALSGSSEIIWAARGGYGSLHLLKHLSKLKKPKVKKILIGFSDVTTLHQFLNCEWGWESWHGPHVDQIYKMDPRRQKELQRFLKGITSEVKFTLKPMNEAAQKVKRIVSKVIGGNLITTQSTFGTQWQIKTHNKILFFEDIGERGYRVDRVLEQMKLLKIINPAKAVIFGPFVGGDEPMNQKSRVEAVLKYFANQTTVPVFRGIGSGHIKDSKILPLGTRSILEKNKISIATGTQN